MKKLKKSDYVVVIGDSYVIRLFGKTEDEARVMYEKAVKDYEELSVTIYKSFSLYKFITRAGNTAHNTQKI